jgi:hypothetical protein
MSDVHLLYMFQELEYQAVRLSIPYHLSDFFMQEKQFDTRASLVCILLS